MEQIKLDTDELRSFVLGDSFYFHDVSSESNVSLETIELDKFDHTKIIEFINNSEKLLSYDKPLLLEVIDAMNKNQMMIGLQSQNIIGLFLNKKQLLRIKLKNNINDPQVLHISLHNYRMKKIEKLTDKKINRVATCGVGGILAFGIFIVGYTMIKSKS